jgi:hypothetical protein
MAFIAAGGAAGPAESQQELPSPEYYHVRGEYSWWWPKLGGEIQKGLSGTITDVTDDLGVTDQSTWELRATARFGASHKLSGTYTQLDYDGDITNHATVRYGDQVYFEGTRLLTSMKGGYYGGQYEWDFAKGPWGFFGGVLGARLLDLDVLLVAPIEARREQESVRVWRPILGVTGRGYLGKRLSIAGTFAGLTVGSRGYALEFEATAQFHIFDRLAIKGGFRSIKVKDETDTTFIEFRNNGGTLGVELSL